MKRTLTGIVAASMVLGTMAPAAFAATSSGSVQWKTMTITAGSSYTATPKGFSGYDHGGTTLTTFAPVYYVEAALKALGYKAAWTGNALIIQTPQGVSPDFSNISVGTGDTSIYVNGTLVKKVYKQVKGDPAAGGKIQTSYIPIYDIDALLKAAGESEQWDGSGWNLTANTLKAQAFLTPIKTIDLPGQGGHGDIVAYDPSEKVMYVSQSPDNNLIIISTVTQKIIKVIPNMKGDQGIAVGTQYVYVANGNANQVAVIQKGTWNVVAQVATGGQNPDGIYYDAQDNKVFVANDDTNTMGVINSNAPFNLESSFDLTPKNAQTGPDLGALVPSKHELYQADDNDVDVINTITNKIEKQYTFNLPLTKTGGTKAMVYDPATHLVWVGTTSKEVITINVDNGKTNIVATQGGMDQISWDPSSKMLFLAESSGALEAINMATQKSIGTVPTEKGAHSLDVDTNKHIVYVYLGNSNKMELFQENMGLLN